MWRIIMEQIITSADLERLKNIDFLAIDPDILADIRDIKVNTNLPEQERLLDYLSQIKNPYCCKYKNTVVKLSYADTKATLEDRLERYLLSM